MSIYSPNRIVVKIGSSSLVNSEESALISQSFTDIASDILWLKKHHNMEIILMSSGALAWGRIILSKQGIKPKNVSPQIAGAVGQVGIASTWASAFRKTGMSVGQYLLKPDDAKCTLIVKNINTMLAVDVVPFINENIPIMDSYDNDGLSAIVAQSLGCKTLVLLSDVDGVYTANPVTTPDAELITEITDIDDAIQRFGGTTTSDVGTGGMLTKLLAAKKMKTIGVETVIASGQIANPLRCVFAKGSGTRIL